MASSLGDEAEPKERPQPVDIRKAEEAKVAPASSKPKASPDASRLL